MSTLNRAIRTEKRKWVLGNDARCEACGWNDQKALVKTQRGVRCYECELLAQGKATSEHHHHLGRVIGPATVEVPGNIHRDLSERQRDWPAEVRSNPERDPLLWLAVAILGIHDHLAWWVDWLERISQWLIRLSQHLANRDGERWCEVTDRARDGVVLALPLARPRACPPPARWRRRRPPCA